MLNDPVEVSRHRFVMKAIDASLLTGYLEDLESSESARRHVREVIVELREQFDEYQAILSKFLREYGNEIDRK